jgi:NAD(P)-dependent dehydrogenase (short-subunit alcohol dehydrogenase family)
LVEIRKTLKKLSVTPIKTKTMTDRGNAIVTGAYGAIGLAIARGIAEKGFRVTLVGRDRARLEQARDAITRQTSNPGIFYEVVDLGSKEEILAFGRRWEGPLHLLLNNAATAPRRRTETAEGTEVQWAVNVLGYFRMIAGFSTFMEGQHGARIVNVASYWAGGLDLRDPEFRNRPYDNNVAYRQAKQANRMLSVAFANRLESKGITVNACHPGDVNSKLSNAFGFGGSEAPDQGAATPLYLALSGEVAGITGKYFEHRKSVPDPFVKDPVEVERLYRACAGDTDL